MVRGRCFCGKGGPKHLGADIGVTAVLHTWGQNFQHHPHVHCIVRTASVSAAAVNSNP
jgi:hypothetical protein